VLGFAQFRRSCARSWSFLAVARFNRNFDFVVTGSLDREQDASIGFVSDQPKQLSLLVILLDEGQSAISNGAGGCSWVCQPQGELPIRTDVAIHKVLHRFRNVVSANIATDPDFEGNVF